eukprot:gene10494-11625_t
MTLRQRKEKADIEEAIGSSEDRRVDLLNRNTELELLVSTLRHSLDFSRKREKRLVQLLHETGLDHVEIDDVLLQHHHHQLDLLQEGQAPEEASFLRSLLDRSGWLIGLLFFQSLSSYILTQNEATLLRHPSIVYFLTMLVGAGGNVGNQAAVRGIRGLALGTLSKATMPRFLFKEVVMTCALSVVLTLCGFLRVFLFSRGLALREGVAIALALFAIVLLAGILGSLLPIAFNSVGVDAAHASTTIQVAMDIVGVFVTCAVTAWLLDSALPSSSDSTSLPVT